MLAGSESWVDSFSYILYKTNNTCHGACKGHQQYLIFQSVGKYGSNDKYPYGKYI